MFFAENAATLKPGGIIEPIAYLWTHTTAVSGGSYVSSDYATYNLTGGTGVDGGPVPTQYFGSSQGFF